MSKKVKETVFTEEPRHGWNSEVEVGEFLAALIKMTKAQTVLEVGTFQGETSKAIISALPQHGQFVTIDIEDYRIEHTKALFKSEGKVIDFIKSDSKKAIQKLPANHFDIVFVDSAHNWDHILPEFKEVERVVARGGVIVYHDSIHIDDVRELVKYAATFGYHNVTLNTPELRGLSILHRKF